VIFEEEYFDEEPPISFANSFRATSSAGYNYTFATSTLDSIASNMYHAIHDGKTLIDRLVGADDEAQLFPFASSRNNALMNEHEPVFFPCGTVGIGSSVGHPIPLVSDSFGCPFELSPITRSRTIVEARTYIDSRSKVRRKWIVTPSGGSTDTSEVGNSRAVRIATKVGPDDEDVENNSPNIYCHFFKGTALINWFDTGNVINPMTRQLVVILDFCRLSNVPESSDPLVDIWGHHKSVTVS